MKEKILKFPAPPEHSRKRAALADYLRSIADYIDSGEIEAPPVGIAMILTSERHHEVLHVGYSNTPGLFRDAAQAAARYASCPYKRRGGNKYLRGV